MRRNSLLVVFTLFIMLGSQAQVTQINSNKSLQVSYPLSATRAVVVSGVDQTLWVTDGSLGGTIQLSATIKFVHGLGSLGFLDGKLIFAGNTAATGTELYITDGTPGGTVLVADINPGVPGSVPDWHAALLNGFIYFTATRPTEGRELWRTNGTLAGTTLVKDIVPGPAGSNDTGKYELFSNGSYLLFAARTPLSGVELWKSNGTDAGTAVLLDINTGHAGVDSSNPRAFYAFNNLVLFAATDATHGEEIWKTDGTAGGTAMLADINPGTPSSTNVSIGIPGFSFDFPVFFFFHQFKNRVYFNANNGTSAGQIWGTDGTVANTTLLKDIVPGTIGTGNFFPFILILDAVNLPNKFIFPVSDFESRSELWESDGTPGGTTLFKTFSPTNAGELPVIFIPTGINSGSVTEPLFQGNKFFFIGGTAAAGTELWISDGTDGSAAHTNMVKDINPGPADGTDTANASYIYTSAGLYFSANNGANGPELWKSDGTAGGTTIVADIVTGLPGSDPLVNSYLVNGKILFSANNGDSPTLTDLYAVDGTFISLPVKLSDFTVLTKAADAVLNWHTQQELNVKNFTVQRSFDGTNFQGIGIVAAAGNSSAFRAYSLVDAGVMNSVKSIAYYRLLTTDKDGKSAFSTIITLKIKNSGSWNVRLLSNPVSENMQVLLSGITKEVQLSIVDINGKKLYTNKLSAVNGQVSLPAGNLPRGAYVLLAETGEERKAIQFVR